MSARIAQLASKRPWVPVLIGIVLAAVSFAVARGISGDLGIGSLAVDDRQEEYTGVLVVTTTNPAGVPDRVTNVALGVIRSQLESDARVATVQRSSAGTTEVLTVTLASGDEGDRQEIAQEISGTIDPGPLRIAVEGQAVQLAAERDRIGGEIWKLELLVVAVLLLILIWGLGLLPGLAAVAAAVFAVLASAALLRAADLVADVSLLGPVAAAPVAIAAAIELGSLLGRRHEEVRRGGAEEGEALTLGLEDWSRRALLWVFAAGVTPLALLATPFAQAGSVALGCALGALTATGGVLLFGTSALAVSAPNATEATSTGFSARLVERLSSGLPWLIVSFLVPLGVAAVGVLGLHTLTHGFADLRSNSTLGADLPLAALAAAILVGALAAAASRSLPALLLGLGAVCAAAGAFGLAAQVFVESDLADTLGMQTAVDLETGAVATGLAVLVSICAARTLTGAVEVAENRRLGSAGDVAAAEAAAVSMRGVILASACVAIAAGALGGSRASAQQFGVIVASGLVLDTVLVRLPLFALAARFTRTRAAADTVASVSNPAETV